MLVIIVATVSLALFLQPAPNEANLLSEPINQPLSYYVESNLGENNLLFVNPELTTDYDSPNQLDEFERIQQRDVPADVQAISSAGLEYLVDQSASKLDSLDARKLINFLNQLKQDDLIADNSGNDINTHLPQSNSPNNAADGVVSDPVNDPAEFEATLSYLTNTLNHELPNSSNRSALLDTLMPVYLGTIMKQLQQQHNQEHQPDKNELYSSTKDSSGSGSSNNNDNNNDNSNLNNNIQQPEETSKNNADSSPAPTSRYGASEYIDHPLALVGHQYVQGGAGEGKQLLGPDGTFENVQVIKTDHAVPSYCDPPNPCPIGFTADDGCLENFVNSASFSREYQAKQQCSCDNEHSLFNCASPVSTLKNQIYSNNVKGSAAGGDDTDSSDSINSVKFGASKLDTLARTIQNRFGNLASVRNLIEKHEEESENNNDDGRLSRVAKKAPRDEANYRY